MNPFAGLTEKPRIEKPERAHKPPQTGWIAPIPNPWDLSGLQCEILKRLAEGGTSKTIGAEFGLNHKTIDAHIDRARGKMAAGNRLRAVVLWVRHEAGGAS